MPFCRFCGKELSEGEKCTCTVPVAANAPSASTSTTPGYDPAFGGGSTPFQVKKDNSLRTKLILIGGGFATLILLTILIIFIYNHTGPRKVARDFSKTMFSSSGGKDFYSMTLPDDAYSALKGNKRDAMVDEYNDTVEELKEDYKVKVKKVKQGKKLSGTELDGAEIFFAQNAGQYIRSFKNEEFKAKKGYIFKITYKVKDKETKDTETTSKEIAVVKFKGEGWKVLVPDVDDDISVKKFLRNLGDSSSYDEDDDDEDEDEDDDDDYDDDDDDDPYMSFRF